MCGLDGPVARRIGEAGVHVQAAIVEIEQVLGIQLFGLLIALGHADDLREAGATGRLVLARRRDPLPEAVQEQLATDIPLPWSASRPGECRRAHEVLCRR